VGGVTGDWKKLHDEELRHLYSSPVSSDDHVKEDKMGRACAHLGGEEVRKEFW
jgi:hypothetical protein